MADTVLYEVRDGLATITINRPEAMNAMDVATKVALRDTLQQAGADAQVRAVLLTAAGDRAFCVGQDLKEHTALLRENRENGGTDTMRTVREHYNPIARAIAGMPKPVVAGINGVAAGAGLGFALAADHRIASDTASFTTSFAGVALSADSGLSWTLPRLVGRGRANDLLLFPRSVPAQEALAIGLVDRLVPAGELAEQAREVAAGLAHGPTLAYAAIKESLAFGAEHSFDETLHKEDELQSRAGASDDHAIAVAAFLAKQKPAFVGH